MPDLGESPANSVANILLVGMTTNIRSQQTIHVPAQLITKMSNLGRANI